MKADPSLCLNPGFLPLAAAAAWSGVSPKTMGRWIAKGLLVYQAGPGEKILIAPEDIRMFLTRRQVATPALDVMISEVVGELQAKAK